MSIEIVEKQILRFVGSSDPTVLALRGPWGAGKTYAWKNFLLQAKKETKIGLEKYAYVSLFGVDSMRALKTAIFERTVSGKDIGITQGLEATADGLSSVTKSIGKKSVRLLNGFFNSHEEALEYLSFSSVRSTLICIDDLERRGEKLSLKEVLGLVSHLSEEKECKIILILNDAENGLEEYQKYKEKVVDVELKFNPTPVECADLAFTGSDGEISQMLTNIAVRLEIRNIRILRKAHNYAQELAPCLNGLEEPLKQEVMRSLMLYVWSAYGESEGAPPIDYMLNSRQKIFAAEDDSSELDRSEEELHWDEILRRVGFSYVDEIELLFIDGVQAGYFDMKSIRDKLELKNVDVARLFGQERYSSAWAVFHHSFDDNENEVIDVLYNEFTANAKYISPINLSGTVELLKGLGEPEKANELLETYIRVRRDEPNLFDLKNLTFRNDVRDPDVIRRFNEIASSAQKEPATLCDVLLQMSGKNGWSGEEEKVLIGASQSDFYDVFKSYKGEYMRSIVRQSLMFDKITNASPDQKAVSHRARAALLTIALESELNRRRISTYGIELNVEEANQNVNI